MSTTPTRAAIVGTAQSWRQTPWSDPSLYIVGINDGYMLGFPRADEWWDLHPLDKLVFRPKTKKVMRAEEIPPGHYVRPEGHIDWLRQQAATIPVWVQDEPPAGWPVNAKRFPIEYFEQKYGTYWASGPAYELMSLYDRGFREIHIYGIHLATEHEYREQRPNFEQLIGRLLGPEVRETRAHQLRIYDGAQCRIVLPESSPVMQHGWKYAYEARPEKPISPYATELHATMTEKGDLLRALAHWPRGKDKRAALARLAMLEIIEVDCRQQLAKQQGSGTLVAQIAA